MFDPSKLQLTPEENNDPLGNGENSNTHEEVTTETITQTKTTPTEQTPENIPQDTPPIEDNIVVPSETAASTPPAETLSPETANDTASPLATPESATMTTTTPPVTDINIQTMDDIIRILVNKSYDFVTIEPQEHEVVLHFKKDKEEKESRSIRFPEYSNILIKVKTITGMNLDTTNKEQEASGKTEQNGIHYELVSKVVPSNF
ncbi:MAG: hypothetical protein H6767_04875 [Candidatus Peribacteria bacterium]|nr:MAG: hypothetical protein H6767_04875 [Candidatus Peribacteria bacterium]